ncbi:hypothetical protein P9213_12680 [Geobacillus stearothermophilus]|uniref:Uncharacterized protein n=1 Tax=Geobacillus stearothermophilus TaxID=1422 RepID=A0A150MXS5_GEOSE|nr:hypothetical protein [Geobacillus stearothermophilus]KAF6511328.1 hypothetical protein GS8_904 [Geobacillus stearothermophilus]KYD29229.1 hypothetical protein B4109_1193 [Geobacillus stearothermophilus]MED3844028.1 hypothetical protein [Geobacillus stearothermophilus]MED4357462.1 hypothetical protein [Geobacillus stearothermophilus]MED5042602.1 hypothetical protein [Geobacillus stearothermophilus]
MLILGPWKMFISSFQGLLPDLNLEGIQQMTFQQLALMILPFLPKGQLGRSHHWYFESVLFDDDELERKRIEFKGSLSFMRLLDWFVEGIKERYESQMQPVMVFDEYLP